MIKMQEEKMTEEEIKQLWRNHEIEAIKTIESMGGREAVIYIICNLADRQVDDDNRYDSDGWKPEDLYRSSCEQLHFLYRKKIGHVGRNEEDLDEMGYPDSDYNEYWKWMFENEKESHNEYLAKEIEAYDKIEAMGGRSTVIDSLCKAKKGDHGKYYAHSNAQLLKEYEEKALETAFSDI